jgi:hypothetical protein
MAPNQLNRLPSTAGFLELSRLSPNAVTKSVLLGAPYSRNGPATPRGRLEGGPGWNVNLSRRISMVYVARGGW